MYPSAQPSAYPPRTPLWRRYKSIAAPAATNLSRMMTSYTHTMSKGRIKMNTLNGSNKDMNPMLVRKSAPNPNEKSYAPTAFSQPTSRR